MADKNRVTVDLTTGVGIICFPRVFKDTADKNDDGTLSYNMQILIPKSDKASVRAIMAAIKKVGEAKWGTSWKKVRSPLRDGDAEADEPTEDGSTKGDKYPERNGHYFLNARSNKPVAVVDRGLSPIVDSDEVYAGCKVKASLTFYPYSTSGNNGVGVGLNGIQKIADGDPIGGGGKPSVEAMFDALDEDDDDLDYDEDEIEEEAPAPKKRAAKKSAKKRAVEEDDEDDLYDEDDDI